MPKLHGGRSASSGLFLRWSRVASWPTWPRRSQWYPPFTMKVWGSLAHISMQKRQTLPVDLSQTEHYFEVTFLNSYLWQQILSYSIYVYVWCSLQKIIFFEIDCQKCQFNFAWFCMHGQLGLRSRSGTNPRLISMPRIQWWYQILQTSFGWKSYFSR